MKRSFPIVFLLTGLCLASPVLAQADSSTMNMTGDPQDKKPKKQDNSIILDMLPGPDHSMGLRGVFKNYSLTITSIEIDHPDPEDPISVKIRFDLPVSKKCNASVSELATYLNRTAIWQADSTGSLAPVNVWARDLSAGHREIFLPEDCPS